MTFCPKVQKPSGFCLQIGFRAQLRREVAAFAIDARDFRADWVANGPMLPNLNPAEAVVRLKLFSQMFEVQSCGMDRNSPQNHHPRSHKILLEVISTLELLFSRCLKSFNNSIKVKTTVHIF